MAGDIDAKLKRKLGRIAQAADELQTALKALRTPEFMQKVGDFAASMIKVRTRLGDGVASQGGSKSSLKPLSKEYIDQRAALQSGAHKAIESAVGSEANYQKKNQKAVYRQSLASAGGLSQFTSPKKSNLTRSGQLLDSIAGKNPTTRTVHVGPTGQRDDGKTNQKIGEYVSDAGRPFNNLSEIELKRVSDYIRLAAKAAIRSVARKGLKK